jgi:dihydrofolate synthase/folylpolyglutamate synthase
MTNKPIVHVAGTNGKGSVAWKISRALREAGYRDGLFVSPHIASFRERIQICGEMISEDDVVASLPWIFELCRKHSVAATFFELTTALAFHHFKSADVVVLEVGLGGRLDATNVVTPTVSVITSIGLDHTRVLGDTVEDIALEKAGVMKPRVPVVVGPRVPIEVLEAKASEVGSPLHRVDFGNDESENGPIFKDFDAENTEIARSTLNSLCGLPGFERLNKRCMDVGVATRPPCRFEELAVSWDAAKRPAQWASVGCNESVGTATRVILDVGHNPPALTQLLSRLASSFPTQPLRFVLGMSRDKDVGECVRLILESLPNLRVSHIHFVAAKHPRAAPPSTMLQRVTDSQVRLPQGERTESLFSVHEGHEEEGSVTAGIYAALNSACRANESNQFESLSSEHKVEEVVVVCGSVFIMAEARTALGFREPQVDDAICA